MGICKRYLKGIVMNFVILSNQKVNNSSHIHFEKKTLFPKVLLVCCLSRESALIPYSKGK